MKAEENKNRDIDVLCVGHACYDLIFTVDRHLGSDEKGFASNLIRCGGGPAANAAFAVVRLGYQAGFLGYLGNDTYGEKHLQELNQVGVNTELIVWGNSPTPLAVILIKPNGDRTVINYKKDTRILKINQIENPVPWQPKVILFDGHEPDISLAILDFARRQHIPTILDAGSVHEGTERLLSKVDFVIASEKFSRDFTQKKDEIHALEVFEGNVACVVITLGERGLVWKNRKGQGKMDAFNVEVLDTTGAGDAFHGGFAVGLASGMKWEKLLRFASAVGALCCTKVGARLGMPTWKEVKRLLSNERRK